MKDRYNIYFLSFFLPPTHAQNEEARICVFSFFQSFLCLPPTPFPKKNKKENLESGTQVIFSFGIPFLCLPTPARNRNRSRISLACFSYFLFFFCLPPLAWHR